MMNSWAVNIDGRMIATATRTMVNSWCMEINGRMTTTMPTASREQKKTHTQQKKMTGQKLVGCRLCRPTTTWPLLLIKKRERWNEVDPRAIYKQKQKNVRLVSLLPFFFSFSFSVSFLFLFFFADAVAIVKFRTGISLFERSLFSRLIISAFLSFFILLLSFVFERYLPYFLFSFILLRFTLT